MIIDDATIPRLPRHYYRRSWFGGLTFIAYALGLWWGAAGCALFILERGSWPVALRLVVALALWFVASQGIHLLGFVGHEGFHFSLLPGKRWSAVVGILVSSMTVVFFQAGVAIDHFNHHRYTNRAGDPDLELFGSSRSFWQRLFLARTRANRRFMRDVVKLLLGRPLGMDERRLPFPRRVYERFAWFNVLCALGWATCYAMLAVSDARAAACLLLAPFIVANLYSGLRPYLEHDDTDDSVLGCARSRTHWFFSLLYCGNNFHLEHHLYPSVPCYRLFKVHRFLVENGYIASTHRGFEPAFLGAYRHAGSRHQYGVRTQDGLRVQDFAVPSKIS